MKWWRGATLLHILENIHIGNDYNHIDPRFTVQCVLRPEDENFHDYRGYAGRVAGGVFKVGDVVVVLPSGFTSKIKTIEMYKEQLNEAFPPMSVTITLEDDIDISRGDMLVRKNNQPNISQDIDLMVCWMSEKPLQLGKKYSIKHTTKDVKCIIKDIVYKVDVDTLKRNTKDKILNLNEIARISIRTTSPLFYDSYRQNRLTGSLIIIDDATNVTVGAGMIK
jgi:sulfate adenylyltransferase subunit 1